MGNLDGFSLGKKKPLRFHFWTGDRAVADRGPDDAAAGGELPPGPEGLGGPAAEVPVGAAGQVAGGRGGRRHGSTAAAAAAATTGRDPESQLSLKIWFHNYT